LEAKQEAELSDAAEGYRVADPWEVDIGRWIDVNRGGAPITTAGILTGALGLEIGKSQQRDAVRVSGVMRKLGYRNIVRRFGYDTQRVWLRVEE
jgi:cytochrome oxidase assembly protein ShyY1